MEQCGDQERAYVGVKIENALRGRLDLQPGQLRMDYDVAGVDVDCKCSKTLADGKSPAKR